MLYFLALALCICSQAHAVVNDNGVIVENKGGGKICRE